MATDISEVQTGKSKRVDASEKRLIEIYNRTQHKRLPIATIYD